MVEQAFYTAFAELDLAAMRRVWSPLAETFCVHPGGNPLRGTDAVLQSWQEIFSSAHPPRITHRLIETHASADLEVHFVEERIQPSGEPGETSLVMATNVYRREPGGWQMVAHHASLPLMRVPRKRSAGSIH
jgi:ketosteroid isomerase-like protein